MSRSRREFSDEESYLIERYGNRYYSSSRWKLPAAIFALIGIPWLLWSAGFHSTPIIRHELIAFKVIDARSIEITYLVERNISEVTMECILVARDFDKNVVGEVTDEFDANPSPAQEVRTRTIPTRSPAVNADVISCDQR